jgi:hypothetical protein
MGIRLFKKDNTVIVSIYAAIFPKILFMAILILVMSCGDSERAKNDADKKKSDGQWYVKEMPGLWVEGPDKDRKTTGEKDKSLEKLRTLGYLSGYKDAPSRSGIIKYDKEKAYNGYNLYISGHRTEAILMDMNGVELHKWHYQYEKIGTYLEPTGPFSKHQTNYWRGIHLSNSGDLLVIYDYLGVLKLDKDSQMQWFYPGRAHHDLDVTEDGTIYVLTTEERIIPRLNKDKVIREDAISVLDSNGNELKRVSLIECFENSLYAQFVIEAGKMGGDIFHTNTIVYLDRSYENKDPAFKRGNILISIRNLSLLAVVDMEKRTISWAMLGPWRFQHEPRMLPNGNILLFDNVGYDSFSRIIEVDPSQLQMVWTYEGDPPSSFSSDYCGIVQRLPNGNTLITETCSGRAFEVTKDTKEIVWEFLNPHRAGDDNELIAALLELIRVSPDMVKAWLKG